MVAIASGARLPGVRNGLVGRWLTLHPGTVPPTFTMAASKYGRSTRAWQKKRAQVLAVAEHCALCGKPLDKALKTPDPFSPEVDHIVPLHRGGPLLDDANLRAAHRACNVKRNAKRKPQEKSRRSRKW